MSKMTYKGYTARIEYDDRDEILVGHLLGITDTVSFHSETVSDLRTEFQAAVEDYLQSCKKLGKQPQSAASGRLMLRVAPEVHRAALIAAQAEGTSLNQWAEHVLREAAHV